jgi:uncharacterized protein RhaS with RHS repeats
MNVYQYALNPTEWIDPLGLQSTNQKIKALQSGKDVTVSNFSEADKVLFGAFPNARKVRGSGNKCSQKTIRQKRAFKLNKNDKEKSCAVYHKDYQSNPETGILYGHEELPDGHPHKTTPHINVLTPEGKKATIFIDNERTK